MPSEIERKFVVAGREPDALGEGEEIRQGYLRTGDPEVRIRRRGGAHTITVKRGSGLHREEEEEGCGDGLGGALLDAAHAVVRKRRHVVGRWEIDVYADRFEGLVVAEVELEAEDEPLPDPPEGIELGRELTDDPRFSNARLAELDEPEARRLVEELTTGR